MSDIEYEENLYKQHEEIGKTSLGRSQRQRVFDKDRLTYASEVDRRIAKAESLLQSNELDKALRILEDVHRRFPRRTDALDKMAEIKLETGRPDQAREILEKSIEIAPATSHEKWLTYAQLLSGEQAASAYREGIRLGVIDLKKKENVVTIHMRAKKNPRAALVVEAKDDLIDLRRQLSSAHCSLVEIYLSDELRNKTKSKKRAWDSIDEALKLAPQSYEAHYTKASYFFVHGNHTAAKEWMYEAFHLWEDADPNEPPTPFSLLNGVKLGLEVRLLQCCRKVLDHLIGTLNIESGEVWHLSAQCSYLMREFEKAYYEMLKAMQVLEKELEDDGKDEDTVNLLQDVTEWIEETKIKHPEVQSIRLCSTESGPNASDIDDDQAH
ncbi:hypothetical protein AAMO2058_001033600 [Amorphochlora amoebiformis]